MVVWALSDRFEPSAVTTEGGLERRDYSRLTESSGAPGCHNNTSVLSTIITQLVSSHCYQSVVLRHPAILYFILRGESRGNIEQSQWSDEY